MIFQVLDRKNPDFLEIVSVKGLFFSEAFLTEVIFNLVEDLLLFREHILIVFVSEIHIGSVVTPLGVDVLDGGVSDLILFRHLLFDLLTEVFESDGLQTLRTSTRRDQVSGDHVFLEAVQRVDLADGGCLGQDTGSVLEAGC